MLKKLKLCLRIIVCASLLTTLGKTTIVGAVAMAEDVNIDAFCTQLLKMSSQLEMNEKTNDRRKDMVNVRSYGARGDGRTDDTQAIQRALDTGKPVFIPKGTYRVNKSLKRVASDKITLIGESGTVIDGTRSTDTTLISLGGSREATGRLQSDVSKGARTIQASLAAAPGDVVLITSTDLFNPARNYYYKGEMAVVESSGSGTIALKGPLFDSYKAAATKVIKLQAPEVYVDNIQVKRNSNDAGLRVSYAKNVVVKNCAISGARERDFSIEYVVKGLVKNNKADDCFYEGTGTSYGICIASSQEIVVTGNVINGGRSGITHGGWEPFRKILVIGNTIDNSRKSTQSSLGFHENGEFVVVKDNKIFNGVLISNLSVTLVRNDITGDKRPAVYYYNDNKECDYIVLKNNNLRSIGSYLEGICIYPVINNTVIKNLLLQFSCFF